MYQAVIVNKERKSEKASTRIQGYKVWAAFNDLLNCKEKLVSYGRIQSFGNMSSGKMHLTFLLKSK